MMTASCPRLPPCVSSTACPHLLRADSAHLARDRFHDQGAVGADDRFGDEVGVGLRPPGRRQRTQRRGVRDSGVECNQDVDRRLVSSTCRA
jgi:hypothetical protein